VSAPARIPEVALKEAAEWFACLAAPAAGEVERERWRDWLAAHADHAAAWDRVERITRSMLPLARAGTAARDALETPRARGRRRSLKLLGVMLLAGGAGLAASRLPWREWRHEHALRRAAYRTALGQVRAYDLPNGGRIYLGTQSMLDIDDFAQACRLHLHAGDMLVETDAHNARRARPFIVKTLHGTLQGQHARFAVRTDSAKTRVDVFDGATQLAAADAHATTQVRAGRYAVFDCNGILANGVANPARGAWARGVLLADGMRLDELLGELARWHAQPLSVAPDIAAVRVVGSYPLHDLDRILTALQASLPIEVRKDAQGSHLFGRPPTRPPAPA